MRFDWTSWEQNTTKKSPNCRRNVHKSRRLMSSSAAEISITKSPSFFFRMAVGGNGYAQIAYMLEIQWEMVKMFSQLDHSCYTLHDHVHGDCSRFHELEITSSNLSHLGYVEEYPVTSAVVVNSHVYAVFLRGITQIIMCRSIHHNDPNTPWETVTTPEAEHRRYPKLISLQGKLYMLGGFPTDTNYTLVFEELPFGEVYDPVSKEWTRLPTPPNTAQLSSYREIFIASLGESEGKILVYNPCNRISDIYIYDVVARVWETFPGCALDSILVNNQDISGTEIVNEDDNNTLYWLGKKSTLIYAFDWKKMQVYSGPIIGMENILDPSIGLVDSQIAFSLYHLSADLFCLLWSSTHDKRTDNVNSRLHFTFLRVKKDPSNYFLDASVVGCLWAATPGHYNLFDAFQIVRS